MAESSPELDQKKQIFIKAWTIVYPKRFESTQGRQMLLRAIGTLLAALVEHCLLDQPPHVLGLHHIGHLLLLTPLFIPHIEQLKDQLSCIKAITDYPTWWGDLLHWIGKSLSSVTNTAETRYRLRTQFLGLMKLEGVYCYREGRSRLLLECECLDWAEYLFGAHIQQEEVPDYMLVNPLQHMFQFHPRQFLPSIEHKIELRFGEGKNNWSHPMYGLPALFAYSKNPQDFDKKKFMMTLTRWKEMGEEQDGVAPMIPLLMGTCITWAPEIHEYASTNDQRRIETFYLASRLDSGSFLYGFPVELFRKVFEENFHLANKHRQCAQCKQDQPMVHGLILGDLKDCSRCECSCEFYQGKLEFCCTTDPEGECWSPGGLEL